MKGLKLKENVLIASLLFGLFFGAGNLIFPVKMGQMAGSNVGMASIGFLITGVGLPILGIVASSISKSDSILSMVNPVGKIYSLIFTCLLYLTIGPLFAIPRTATVAFEVGIRPFLNDSSIKIALLIFSFIFFMLTLYFALRPNRIIDWIGKYLTPIFLILLSILIIASIVNPISDISLYKPQDNYASLPLIAGFLAGYNTMDALASLAFAIIIISNIEAFGVKNPTSIAKESLKSGIICIIAMSIIYVSLSFMGASSNKIISLDANGGGILSSVSGYYLGIAGQLLLAAIVTAACLKTAIGLITACSQIFEKMFPNSISYSRYAIIFTIFSFIIANFGLNSIINYSVPMLMFLYPISIVIIILSIFAPLLKKQSDIYRWTLSLTTIAAIFDFIKAFPFWKGSNFIKILIDFAKSYLPLFDFGFGFLLPAICGFIIGGLIALSKKQ